MEKKDILAFNDAIAELADENPGCYQHMEQKMADDEEEERMEDDDNDEDEDGDEYNMNVRPIRSMLTKVSHLVYTLTQHSQVTKATKTCICSQELINKASPSLVQDALLPLPSPTYDAL